MSTYTKLTKHPNTGKFEVATSVTIFMALSFLTATSSILERMQKPVYLVPADQYLAEISI